MSTFAAWLLAQAGRRDEVGALARQLAADQAVGCDGALLASTYTDLSLHMLFDHEVDPAQLEVLQAAHEEWPGADSEPRSA